MFSLKNKQKKKSEKKLRKKAQIYLPCSNQKLIQLGGYHNMSRKMGCRENWEKIYRVMREEN